MWNDVRVLVVFIAIGLTADMATRADQVDLATARRAVENWAGRAEYKLGASLGSRVKAARSHVAANGDASQNVGANHLDRERGGLAVAL